MKPKLLLGVGIIAALAIILLIWPAIDQIIGPGKSPPLKIGISVYPGFAPFFVAQEKGFFAKEGVNAEIVTITDANQLISALAGNQVQLLTSTADFTTVVADAGVDIKEIFATDIGYGSDGLLTKNDVNSINDLKGKTIYLSLGTPSHFLLRTITKDLGFGKNDIALVQMEADQVGAAFVAGKIDYGMSWEPWLSKASERKDGKLLFSSRDKPGIITDTIVVRTDILQSRRKDVKAIMRAWFDAVDFVKSNPEEANAIMARNLGVPMEDFKAQLQTVKLLDYAGNMAKFDKSSELNVFELTEQAVEIYLEDGIIKSEVRPKDLIDPQVLAELSAKAS